MIKDIDGLSRLVLGDILEVVSYKLAKHLEEAKIDKIAQEMAERQQQLQQQVQHAAHQAYEEVPTKNRKENNRTPREQTTSSKNRAVLLPHPAQEKTTKSTPT